MSRRFDHAKLPRISIQNTLLISDNLEEALNEDKAQKS